MKEGDAQANVQVRPTSGAALGSPVADPALVAALDKKFDDAMDAERNQKYTISCGRSVMNNILGLVKTAKWKGLEAFVVQKCYDEIAPQVESGPLDATSIEITGQTLNAVSHYLTTKEGDSYEEAVAVIEIAEAVAPAMEKFQAVRKHLSEIALELDAARKGMTAEELREVYSKGQAE